MRQPIWPVFEWIHLQNFFFERCSPCLPHGDQTNMVTVYLMWSTPFSRRCGTNKQTVRLIIRPMPYACLYFAQIDYNVNTWDCPNRTANQRTQLNNEVARFVLPNTNEVQRIFEPAQGAYRWQRTHYPRVRDIYTRTCRLNSKPAPIP